MIAANKARCFLIENVSLYERVWSKLAKDPDHLQAVQRWLLAQRAVTDAAFALMRIKERFDKANAVQRRGLSEALRRARAIAQARHEERTSAYKNLRAVDEALVQRAIAVLLV